MFQVAPSKCGASRDSPADYALDRIPARSPCRHLLNWERGGVIRNFISFSMAYHLAFESSIPQTKIPVSERSRAEGKPAEVLPAELFCCKSAGKGCRISQLAEFVRHWFEASRSIHLSYGRALVVRVSLPSCNGAPPETRADLRGVQTITLLLSIKRLRISRRSARSGPVSAAPTLPRPPGSPARQALPPAPPLRRRASASAAASAQTLRHRACRSK